MASFVPASDAAAGTLLAQGQALRPCPGDMPPHLLLAVGRADGAPDVHARHLQQGPPPEGRLLVDLR